MSDDDYTEGVEYDLPRQLSDISELNSISKFLNDPDVDFALEKVINLIVRPDVPAKLVTPLINKLQGISFSFKMKGKCYMLLRKSDPDSAQKKNMYMTLSEETEKLVQALKYTTRNY